MPINRRAHGRVKLAALWLRANRIDRVGFDAFDVVLDSSPGFSSRTYTCLLDQAAQWCHGSLIHLLYCTPLEQHQCQRTRFVDAVPRMKAALVLLVRKYPDTLRR